MRLREVWGVFGRLAACAETGQAVLGTIPADCEIIVRTLIASHWGAEQLAAFDITFEPHRSTPNLRTFRCALKGGGPQ